MACLCSMISRISVAKNRGLVVTQWLEARATGSFVLSHVEPGLSVNMAASAQSDFLHGSSGLKVQGIQ